MPRSILAAVAACTLVVAYFVPQTRASAATATPMVRVLVHLSGQPAAADPYLRARTASTLGRLRYDPTLPAARQYSAALGDYQTREISYIKAQGIRIDVARQLAVLFNGFAATIPANQVARLSALKNVTAVLPDRKVVPLDDRSVSLVHVQQAWSLLGGPSQAGRKIFIADLDTGIDTSNPCFRDAGFTPPSFGRRADNADNLNLTNNKVIVARAFGANANGHYSAADSEGHGTFTAAIETCDANTQTPLGTAMSGMAPGAYVGNYNVFPNTNGDSSGSQDTIIAGIEAALQDGADVANLSLGYPFQVGDPRLDPDVQASDLATKAGMVIVYSAGNAGPTPQSVQSPSTGPDVISVGASTNSRGIFTSIHVSGAGVPSNVSRLDAALGSHGFTGTVGPLPMVYVGLGRKPNDDTDNPNADDFAGKDLHGKIALIDRGTTFFETKINNAAAAGASAVILMDNRFELGVPGFDMKTATLPSMMVSQQEGQALKAYVLSHPDAQATLDPTKVQVDETPNYLSDFSSRGFGPGYAVKPDLVAPGQDIYSATETQTASDMSDPSGFTLQNGTSFSAPHVTGAVALVLAEHPKWTPAMVKAVLMETADRHAITVVGQSQPSVMDVGAGLLDSAAASSVRALITPYSFSLGQINLVGGAFSQTVQLTLADVGGGSGTWSAAVDPLHTADGIQIGPPGSVQLSATGSTSVPVKVAISQSTPAGSYDGYIVLTNGASQLHVPYFVKVISKAITPGSVLLVDDTTTRYQPDASKPPIQRLDVSRFWEKALDAVGRPYTYWDEALYGTPSLEDMKRSSAVIYFTGKNFNGYASQNANYEAMLGPLSSPDVATLHSYLDGGGKLFISGMAAALTDLTWSQFVLGASVVGLSEYDNASNDKKALGGISPPQPSAVSDDRPQVLTDPWLFSGMKLDFSNKGDGAGDNMPVVSQATPDVFGPDQAVVGVTGMLPYSGSDSFFGDSFGKAVLRTTDLRNTAGPGLDVAIASSDDPTLSHQAKYPGRSVLFSFGFEGINDNTGFATRAQVLQRVLSWLDDAPKATVAATGYTAGVRTPLRATLTAAKGIHAVHYRWEIGKTVLSATSRPTRYTFPHAGNYKIRVDVTDSLGHDTVSAWRTVRVH